MNSNDLVVPAWEHTFLDDITRNLVVLYRLITEFLYSTVLQLFNYLPEHLIRSKTKLTLLHEMFCKKTVLEYLLKFSGKYLYRSLF